MSRYLNSVILISSLSVLSSCAWYRDLERTLVEDDQKQAATRKSRVVPRAQYDELLMKYDELQKKYDEVKSGKPSSESLVDELQRTQAENFSNTAKPNSVETVDVFAGAAPIAGTTAAVDVALPQIGKDEESQISAYRQGLVLVQTNPTEALKVFQQLDAKGIPAIKVRAKLQIGMLLMKQNQYDLALQSFEDIIQKYSYSGVVIEALRNASICGDKLGLAVKRDQYASMLKDVFEMN